MSRRTLSLGRRGRVPFALIGVLLLVGSTTVVLTADRERAEPAAVPVATERVTADASAALADAVRAAGRDAAADPVLTPANTSGGRVLNESTPFRDALRVRIAVAARRALRTVATRVGPASARATLPEIADAADLRRAKRAVTIRSANGTLHATVENVTVVVRRDGRVVNRTRRSFAVRVASPAVALHERVERFERQANRGPTAGPGLGRRLSASLYALAWGRGYAQYGGLPVQNVVATRHVELATNGGLLATQRAVFGGVDPAARGAYLRAAAHVGVRDLVAPKLSESKAWLDTVLGGRFGSAAVPMVLPAGRPPGGGPGPTTATTIGVNGTADRALAGSLAPEGAAVVGATAESVPTVETAVRSVYGARVRTLARVATDAEAEPEPSAPGPDWELVGSERERTTSVGRGSAPLPAAPDGAHVLATRGRTVTVRHVRTDRWRRGNRTRTTVARWTTTHRVGVAVVGEHAPSGVAPDEPIAGVHGAESPLSEIDDRAVARTLAARGGADAVARRAVRGRLNDSWVRLDASVPERVRTRVLADTLALARRVENVTVTVERGRLATDARPAAALAAELRDSRRELLDAPDRYDSVAAKARVAARAAYLERAIARLDARSDRVGATQTAVDDALADAGASGGLDPGGVVAAVGRATAGEPRPVRVGPTARRPLSIHAAPAYLTTASVDRRRVPAVDGEYVPLATRNRNVFTAPYAEAASGAVDAVLPDAGGGGERRVSLRAAATTLRAAERTPNRSVDPADRARLRRTVAAGVGTATERAARRLAATTDLSRPGAEAVVAAGLSAYATPAARALALANGRAVGPTTAAAAARLDLREGGDGEPRQATQRELLAVRVRAAVEAGVGAGQVRRPADPVETVGATVREYGHRAVTAAVTARVGNATERLRKRARGRLAERYDSVEKAPSVPAGLPLTPVPGYWYATANVWHVEARGEYARFAVAAPVGDAGAPGAVVRYVRDGGAATLDWDGDGTDERLGTSDRVSFSVETAVVVVVPPGPEGVGDRDGVANETSSGWPDPGPAGTDAGPRPRVAK